jgi:hypothetical protein
MSMVYFTIVAIILYVTADWLLERVEVGWSGSKSQQAGD